MGGGARSEWSWTGVGPIGDEALVAVPSDLVRSGCHCRIPVWPQPAVRAFGCAGNMSALAGERSRLPILCPMCWSAAFCRHCDRTLGSVVFERRRRSGCRSSDGCHVAAGVASIGAAACVMGGAMLWPAASTWTAFFAGRRPRQRLQGDNRCSFGCRDGRGCGAVAL